MFVPDDEVVPKDAGQCGSSEAIMTNWFEVVSKDNQLPNKRNEFISISWTHFTLPNMLLLSSYFTSVSSL